VRSSADGLSAGCSTVNIAATCRSSCRGCASVQDRALVPLREGCKVYRQSSRFPETPTTSLDVLQPWPLPSSRLVSPRNQAAMITSPRCSAPLAALLQRVREQYQDMPGLKLPEPQATRLFGVAPSVCAAIRVRPLARHVHLHGHLLHRPRRPAATSVHSSPAPPATSLTISA